MLVTGWNPSHIRVLADTIVQILNSRKLNERGVMAAMFPRVERMSSRMNVVGIVHSGWGGCIHQEKWMMIGWLWIVTISMSI